MAERPSEMPFLGNIGLIVTYKCQVRCPHCILDAGPHRKEELQINDALNWIKQISNYRKGTIFVLSLTGGEPFYNLETLKTISEYANSLGLFVSAVTNAYWAKSLEQACAVLENIPAIRMLSISTDTYHQKFIPLQHIKNAISVMERYQIPYTVAVCTENQMDNGYQKIYSDLLEITSEDKILTAVTFPVGRAQKNVDPNQYPICTEPPISACAAGSSPIIFPNGKVIACIGPVVDIQHPHALLLGNLRDESLEEILDRAETNPILHAIRI